MKKIAIEFEAGVVDARALARAVAAVFEASSVGDGAAYIDGFSMNSRDGWQTGDPRITITTK